MRHVRTLVAEGRFGDAIRLCRLIEGDLENKQEIAAELKRILTRLRSRLRQSQDGEDEVREQLELVLAIAPADPTTLRWAAVEATKRQQYELALEFWKRVDAVAPGEDGTARQIKRCELIVRRETGRRRAEPPPPNPREYATATATAPV